jgi:hypothetical protein
MKALTVFTGTAGVSGTTGTFTGTVTANSFTGSGAGLTTGTIPNAALVTTPGTVTGVTGTSPIVSSGGAAPAISVAPSPTLVGTVTAGSFVGTVVPPGTVPVPITFRSITYNYTTFYATPTITYTLPATLANSVVVLIVHKCQAGVPSAPTGFTQYYNQNSDYMFWGTPTAGTTSIVIPVSPIGTVTVNSFEITGLNTTTPFQGAQYNALTTTTAYTTGTAISSTVNNSLFMAIEYANQNPTSTTPANAYSLIYAPTSATIYVSMFVFVDNAPVANGVTRSYSNTLSIAETGYAFGFFLIPAAQTNAAIGTQSLNTIQSSPTYNNDLNNVAVGNTALKVANASQNTAVGALSLVANTTGGSNTALGYNTSTAAITDTNEIVIGAGVVGIGSNSIAIGGATIAGHYSGTGVPTFSAPNSSVYFRYDGGTGSRMYINTSGPSSSGTTWTATAY